MKMENRELSYKQDQKLLKNTQRMRFWLCIGGGASALSAILNTLTGDTLSLFSLLLPVGCLGYAILLTPRIRKIQQALLQYDDR